ncbi:CU044_5270 family protein [Actinomadura rugatobispora]|uniref:CU044_5270 family protein n=1 Tax=Actinomadura rugatobispora TaxID=1994 RepID=A0ABW0ZW58_9ACTN|nr:CU044_5270 family protein [Actinomadura rugatobispora]
MDDDLRTIAAVLAPPEPSPGTVERSRRRLEDRTARASAVRRPPWRRPKLVWPASAGLALAAAGTAAAIAVSSGPAPTPLPVDGPPPSGQASGRQVLLVAATAAERAPAGSGTYWYVKMTTDTFGYETWARRDGQEWMRGDKTQGRLMKSPLPASFVLAGQDLSVARIERLPTSPSGLRAAVTDIVRNSDARDSAGRRPADRLEQETLLALVSLVSQLPAPPKVRAAALRAIAKSPGVEDLGETDGGRGVLLPLHGDQVRLVVNMATGQVSGTSFLMTADGAEMHIGQGGTATVTAHWTDRLPR